MAALTVCLRPPCEDLVNRLPGPRPPALLSESEPFPHQIMLKAHLPPSTHQCTLKTYFPLWQSGYRGIRRVLVFEKSALPRWAGGRAPNTQLTDSLHLLLHRRMPRDAQGTRLTSHTNTLTHTHNREETPWVPHRDAWWHDEVKSRPEFCPPEWMDAGGRGGGALPVTAL